MGNNDDGKSSKSEKSSLPGPQDQTNLHIHPDWAAMQAYYGPQVAMAPYYSSAMASGHPPPYMWGPPQHMMPPYGAPYATIYPHGGVYTHPAVPVGSPAPAGHGIPSSPMATTPSSVETSKIPSLGNNDQSLTKTVKGFNGLSMSTGKNVAATAKHKPSQSSGHEGSSDGSDGNTTETDETRKKRSREGSPTTGAEGLELEKHRSMNVKSNPSEPWFQDERELKREKRKQSNRESARRSRLRKQAETEELARKVESLTAENVALKCELTELAEKAEKLKEENAALGEKLKSTESGQASETVVSSRGGMGAQNLLSSVDGEGEMYNKGSKSGVKLHQLMGRSTRADAVAAS